MSELQAQFDQAVSASRSLAARPDNDTLLQIYALYKQATQGDVAGGRPGLFDPVGRAKYDAWAKMKGLSREGAMQQYVSLIARLQKSA